MFPGRKYQTPKKPNFIRYLFLFNLLLPLFMIVARLVWGQDFFSVSPNGALFWPGAVSRFIAGAGVLVVFRCSVYDLVLPYQQKLRSNAYAAIYFMAFCISWQ
ncbi:hypothetical protein KIF59_16810 [Enterobacter cloacae subsp. cloacae]|nr:hypothetical protein [Enterobacter cloacae subsp. cloacae]